jgi:hypothetical protein
MRYVFTAVSDAYLDKLAKDLGPPPRRSRS